MKVLSRSAVRLAALGLVLGGLLSGCALSDTMQQAASAASAAGFTGTRSATANGMNGDVTVTLTWEDGHLTGCTVDAEEETPDIGQTAAQQLETAILEAGSPNVDAVAGATITSNAVLDAARACCDEAGVPY